MSIKELERIIESGDLKSAEEYAEEHGFRNALWKLAGRVDEWMLSALENRLSGRGETKPHSGANP